MFSYNGGCLPPQLPPLPLPHYYHHPVMQPPQWMPQYPAPNMYLVPPPQQLSSVPPHFLPHPPPYTTNFTPGGRGRGRGGRQAFNSRNKPTWNVQKCDPCNKVYKTEETFAEHLQSHVKCTQCDFTALPKKVKEHSQVHSLPDFLSFKSDNDVKRWRDERKRNYPTASNIEKKIKNKEQKNLRGQTIDTPLYRYVNQLIGDYDSRCRGRGGRRGNNRGRWNTQRRHNQSGYRNEQTTVSDTDIISTPVPTNNNDSPNATCPSTINNQEPTKTNRRNREMKRQRHPEKGNGPVKKHKHCDWTALSVPNNPSLLEKLLASNVRSEHNAILQCVRYTVQNNFFQTISTSNKNNDCCTISSNSTNSTISTTDEVILPEL